MTQEAVNEPEQAGRLAIRLNASECRAIAQRFMELADEADAVERKAMLLREAGGWLQRCSPPIADGAL